MVEPTAAFSFAAKLAMDAGGEASMPFPAGDRPAHSDPGLAWPTRADFMHYAYNNPVWRAARATGRFFDSATDPKNFGNELSAGVDAATAGDGGAAPAAPAQTPKPSVAQIQAQAPDYSPTAMYGAGGAGIGALLGAALGRKGTRGRNALIGGALGGGAGLLAQHLMSQKKSAARQAPINPHDISMGQFAGGTGAAGAIGGGIAGLAGGGLAGLLSPGEYEEDGVKKRRSRLMGALLGAGKGGLVGAAGGGALGAAGGAGLLSLSRIMHDSVHGPRVAQDKTAADKIAFDPRPADQTVDGGGAIQTPIARFQRIKGSHAVATKSGAFDFGQMLNQAGTYAKDMYNKVPESVRSGIGMGGLGGAALGGLAGLVAPGETNEYDEFGRVVGRKQRNRFGAMLRGALGGGALGAVAGGAAGHFAPGYTQQAANSVKNFGRQMTEETRAALGYYDEPTFKHNYTVDYETPSGIPMRLQGTK